VSAQPSAAAAARVVLAAADRERCVRRLAAELDEAHPEGDLVLVALLPKGGRLAADLSRALAVPHVLDDAALAPYRAGGRSDLSRQPRTPLAGRSVVVVDTVADTGLTLRAALRRLAEQAPASLEACVLLDRPARRLVSALPLVFVGLTTSEDDLAGFGLGDDSVLAARPDIVSLSPR
jgi:hypoxanthine phosphoribosyltransferase